MGSLRNHNLRPPAVDGPVTGGIRELVLYARRCEDSLYAGFFVGNVYGHVTVRAPGIMPSSVLLYLAAKHSTPLPVFTLTEPLRLRPYGGTGSYGEYITSKLKHVRELRARTDTNGAYYSKHAIQRLTRLYDR